MVQPAPTSSRGFLPRTEYTLCIRIECLYVWDVLLSSHSLPNSSGVKNHPGHFLSSGGPIQTYWTRIFQLTKSHVILISKGVGEKFTGDGKVSEVIKGWGGMRYVWKRKVRHRKKITFLEDGWLWWRITDGLTDFMQQILQDFTRHVQAVQS